MKITDGSAVFEVKDIRENEKKIQDNKASIATLQTELQKQAQAMTGYVPLDWSKAKITRLMHTSIDKGDITLSQPYTDFDYLWIFGGDDAYSYIYPKLLSKFELDYLFSDNIKAADVVLWTCYGNAWRINPKTSTPTVFKTTKENCAIATIFGIKIAE